MARNHQLSINLVCQMPNKNIWSSLHLKNKNGIIVLDIFKIWEEDIYASEEEVKTAEINCA